MIANPPRSRSSETSLPPVDGDPDLRLRPAPGTVAQRHRPAAPANVVPPGYCPNLASVAVAPATSQPVTGKPNTMPPNTSARSRPKHDEVLLDLPAPAGQSVRAAPARPDDRRRHGHSTYNPMIVVDALRFPYIEGGGTAGPPATPAPNTIFSSQRCQPFRGGHAVRLPSDTSNAAGSAVHPLRLQRTDGPADLSPTATTGTTMGSHRPAQITQNIYHTLGNINDQAEPWDYFPFNDRDFTSVAELMLVPGCPPGLFTKQFVELAPMPPSTTTTPTSPPVDIPGTHHHPDQPERR